MEQANYLMYYFLLDKQALGRSAKGVSDPARICPQTVSHEGTGLSHLMYKSSGIKIR